MLPFWLLYALSDFLCAILFYVFRYRRKVVRQNLQRAFPEQTAAERQLIAKKFYHNFCDILLETIKGFSLSESDLRQRYLYRNPDLIRQQIHKGQSVLLIGSHLTNWEWGVLSVPLRLGKNVTGIYKPLGNPALDEYLCDIRRRWGLQLVSMQECAKLMLRQSSPANAYVFFSDQSPSNTRSAHWLDFFGQDTAFLPGVDKLARRTAYPVYWFDIRRVKRGYYEVDFELLEGQAQHGKEGDVTARYAQMLEKRIRQRPEDWLWSHKRWKHQRN